MNAWKQDEWVRSVWTWVYPCSLCSQYVRILCRLKTIRHEGKSVWVFSVLREGSCKLVNRAISLLVEKKFVSSSDKDAPCSKVTVKLTELGERTTDVSMNASTLSYFTLLHTPAVLSACTMLWYIEHCLGVIPARQNIARVGKILLWSQKPFSPIPCHTNTHSHEKKVKQKIYILHFKHASAVQPYSQQQTSSLIAHTTKILLLYYFYYFTTIYYYYNYTTTTTPSTSISLIRLYILTTINVYCNAAVADDSVCFNDNAKNLVYWGALLPFLY